jgi:hypothetical protein
VLTWVQRLGRLVPLGALSLGSVRFDLQLLDNPEIAGVAYQHGELAGDAVRAYVLQQFDRRCAYCTATGVPVQLEHVVPRARGGSDRVSTLALACAPCNPAKGTQTAAAFGHPEGGDQAGRPLSDAAAIGDERGGRPAHGRSGAGSGARAVRHDGDLCGAPGGAGAGAVHRYDASGVVPGISIRACRPLQRGDGYSSSERRGSAACPCLTARGSALHM